MMQEGSVALEDGVNELLPFEQTTGIAQGDNLSPLLFTILLRDFPEYMREKNDLVYSILYADDAVLYSRSRQYLKQAMRTLENYSTENGLTMNTEKTKMMKFGRGGPRLPPTSLDFLES